MRSSSDAQKFFVFYAAGMLGDAYWPPVEAPMFNIGGGERVYTWERDHRKLVVEFYYDNEPLQYRREQDGVVVGEGALQDEIQFLGHFLWLLGNELAG